MYTVRFTRFFHAGHAGSRGRIGRCRGLHARLHGLHRLGRRGTLRHLIHLHRGIPLRVIHFRLQLRRRRHLTGLPSGGIALLLAVRLLGLLAKGHLPGKGHLRPLRLLILRIPGRRERFLGWLHDILP